MLFKKEQEEERYFEIEEEEYVLVNGKLVKLTKYNSDGNKKEISLENGRETSICIYKENKLVEKKFRNENKEFVVIKYDEKGNVLSHTVNGEAVAKSKNKRMEHEMGRKEKTTTTPAHGRASMERTAAKPYYGHHAGGIDDTIARLDKQERTKMMGIERNKNVKIG